MCFAPGLADGLARSTLRLVVPEELSVPIGAGSGVPLMPPWLGEVDGPPTPPGLCVCVGVGVPELWGVVVGLGGGVLAGLVPGLVDGCVVGGLVTGGELALVVGVGCLQLADGDGDALRVLPGSVPGVVGI